jgi:hypothetical protein
MNKLIQAAAVVIILAAPVASFAQAQSNAPVTRAEVKAKLAQLEQAGYNPAENDPYYPQNLQAAELRVQQASVTTPGSTSYGPVANGTTQAGHRATPRFDQMDVGQ